MIESYRWQGHPRQQREKDVGFYIIQKSRFMVGGHAGDGEYQYLGWFYMNGRCHFNDRLNHSAEPQELQDIILPLTKKNWQGMIKDIFEEKWEIKL